MKLILRIIITAILVVLLAHLLPGVHVASFTIALVVALVLALLNIFFKPIMVLLTFPITMVTMGLFLLVINGLIIILCTKIVGGFLVDSFWIAMLFSVLLSIMQSIAFTIIGDKS